MEKLVGRETEQDILKKVLASKNAELVAVYGRRRVGKTFLIRQYCKESLVFEFTGVHNASLKDQLQNFTQTLQRVLQSPVPMAPPDNWLQAFTYLNQYLASLPNDKPAV